MSTYLKRKEEMAWQTTRKISLKAYLVFSPPSFFSLLLLKAFLNLLCFELCDESERFLCCVPFPDLHHVSWGRLFVCKLHKESQVCNLFEDFFTAIFIAIAVLQMCKIPINFVFVVFWSVGALLFVNFLLLS